MESESWSSGETANYIHTHTHRSDRMSAERDVMHATQIKSKELPHCA